VTERFSKAEREKHWRRLEWLRESLTRDRLGDCSLADLARDGNADALEICRTLDRLMGKDNDARRDAAPRVESFCSA